MSIFVEVSKLSVDPARVFKLQKGQKHHMKRQKRESQSKWSDVMPRCFNVSHPVDGADGVTGVPKSVSVKSFNPIISSPASFSNEVHVVPHRIKRIGMTRKDTRIALCLFMSVSGPSSSFKARFPLHPLHPVFPSSHFDSTLYFF